MERTTDDEDRPSGPTGFADVMADVDPAELTSPAFAPIAAVGAAGVRLHRGVSKVAGRAVADGVVAGAAMCAAAWLAPVIAGAPAPGGGPTAGLFAVCLALVVPCSAVGRALWGRAGWETGDEDPGDEDPGGQDGEVTSR